MRFWGLVAVVVMALAARAQAQAQSADTQILSDVTNRACSAAMADQWQYIRTDGHFIARGDALGRVHLYASPADAAAGVNPENSYLVNGDFVEQPAADTDDWTNLSAAAAQSLPGSDAATGKPDLRLTLEQDADPGKAGIADCIRYRWDGRKPVFGWVRPANLGALPQHFSDMDKADQAAMKALPGLRWPAQVGGDGRDEDAEGIFTVGLKFYRRAAARDAAAAHAEPYEFYELVDDKLRWADDDVDDVADCGFSIYLLNNAVFVPPEDGFDCWGDHGQDDPDGVYFLP